MRHTWLPALLTGVARVATLAGGPHEPCGSAAGLQRSAAHQPNGDPGLRSEEASETLTEKRASLRGQVDGGPRASPALRRIQRRSQVWCLSHARVERLRRSPRGRHAPGRRAATV